MAATVPFPQAAVLPVACKTMPDRFTG